MLKAVIDRAGFGVLMQLSKPDTSSKDEVLAAVPSAVGHFVLDALFERRLQAELVGLLILPQEGARFTTCVLLHGMGGTGKTVTAVAVVQDTEVRKYFLSIYRLAAGYSQIRNWFADQKLVARNRFCSILHPIFC